MKVFIADETKLDNYLLPAKVEDSFSINYVSTEGVLENITLKAQNGSWTINQTLNMLVKKEISTITSDVLKDLNFYDIKFSDIEETVKLYCFDTPIKYESYSIINKAELSLGRTSTDIEYDSVGISNLHFRIIKENDNWNLISEENTYTYLNGKRCFREQLKRGDIIFADGLKIIWMETFIMLNNIVGKLKVNLEIQKSLNTLGQDNLYTPVKETEKLVTLYKDDEVFFHTPRIKSTFEEKIISISPPPPAIKDEGPPAILTLGATIMMGISSSITGIIAIFSVASGKSTLLGSITEITICLAMIMGCVLFPILLDKYQKKKIKSKEEKRQKKYSEYLENKKRIINETIIDQTKILFENNPSPEELKQNIISKTNRIWSREIFDNDFLTFRLGLGNKEASIRVEATIEDFSLEDDNLRENVEKIKNQKLELKEVPITTSIVDNKILPLIIGDKHTNRKAIIDNIMLQLISYYSGLDLKIVIFTDKDREKEWEYFKYLPHCCSNDDKTRLFATNEDEMKQLSAYLENIYNDRINKINGRSTEDGEKEYTNADNNSYYKGFNDYYLIITDNYVLAKRFGIINKIVNSSLNIGFSLLTIEPTMQNIPSRCNKYIKYENQTAGLFSKDLNDQNQYTFIPDLFQDSDFSKYIETIANIPVTSTSLINQLPTSLNFLEMYKVGKIEQLNILNRWINNNPTISLKTPIGVHEDGKVFELDLHEKYHGPHGLIAGSTGSGKSEFIITFILSMAINYHPDEVQFVLIDYKGGGLAGAFENRETGIKIPHLVGTITNLDTGEMNRTLVSINSELKRRQRMFNEARDQLGESTVDIYKYQKFYREGKVKEPISHLFIISDEFAELKAQQPDFMDELISAARIGRSLGVHLILATQKPNGVVDDQIWSNAKFKICLKVQTSEDSMEMLKRTEAASIKETGRFYLQVGYDELFEIGQSAWSGAKYLPLDKVTKTIDDSIHFIDNNGNLISKVTDIVKQENQVDYGDQLNNIVKNLYSIATRENINFKQLWLPSIPKEIYLMNTINKYKYTPKPFEINPVIGEYDHPAAQLQKVLTVDFTNTGNLLIYGNPGSGKENLLMTIIYSICLHHSTEEVNFYILDFGAEVLKIFSNLPQVGDVVLTDDKDKVKSLLLMLDREMNHRKDLFSDFGGTYSSYIKNSEKKLPLLMIVLNGYEAFVENYGNYDDFLVHLIRESSKYGIIFTMTTTIPASVRTRISQGFNNKIALQLSDSFDYKFYLDAPNGLTPSKYFGRGIVSMDDTAYEFQTCFIYERDKINDIIRSGSEKMKQIFKKARPIPMIPNNITYDTLSNDIDNITNVPVGINIYDANICKYNFIQNKITQIIGNSLLYEFDFINNLIAILSSIPDLKVKVIDFAECIQDSTNMNYIHDNFTQNIQQIIVDEQANINKTIYVIMGLGYIYDKVLDEGINTLFSIFQSINNFKNSYFVFMDNYATYKKIMNESWYSNVVNSNDGIWIGKGVDIQKAIHVNELNTSDVNEEFKGLAYVVRNNEYELIKCLTVEEGGGSY